jgi:hypothetical protein
MYVGDDDGGDKYDDDEVGDDNDGYDIYSA